jgi:hypothetical protein
MNTAEQYGPGWRFRAPTVAVRDHEALQIMPGRDSEIAKFAKSIGRAVLDFILIAAIGGVAVATLVTLAPDLPNIIGALAQ